MVVKHHLTDSLGRVYLYAPTHVACQTFLERVMPMVFNGFVVTAHAVIASVVASLLLPQEYC